MDRTALLSIVDDDEAVRKSLARLLTAAGFQVRSYATGRHYLDEADPASPGCLLLDLSMPDLDGLAVQEAMNARKSMASIVFLTGRASMKDCVTGMQRGASNFLVKPYVTEELLAAVRRGLQESVQRADDQQDLLRLLERFKSLTQRETEVMHLVARGLLNKQIADLIGAAERTVKLHRARGMEKLDVGSVAELVRLVDRAATAGR